MNWKGRQMFGGRPSGIVQMMGGGMTPYPTHTMPNGTVMPGATHGAGYEAGGMIDAGRAGGILGGTAPDESSMEQRIAQTLCLTEPLCPELCMDKVMKQAVL